MCLLPPSYYLVVSEDRRRLLQAALQREGLSFRQQTFASNTKKSYRIHRNAYLTFCNSMGHTAVPATTQTICLYASFLARLLKYNNITIPQHSTYFAFKVGIPQPSLGQFLPALCTARHAPGARRCRQP